MPFTKSELEALLKDPRLTPEERKRVIELRTEQTLNIPDKPKGGSQVGRAARGLALGGGFIPNPLVRLPLVVGGGVVSDISEGKSLKQAARRQASWKGGGAMSELLFPGVSKLKGPVSGVMRRASQGLAGLLPSGGVNIGLRLGGLKGDVGRASDAFLRERARHGWFGGILPGTVGKVAHRRKALGTALETAERAAPGEVGLAQTVAPALGSVRTFGKSQPHLTAQKAVSSQKAFLRKPSTVKGFGTVGHPKKVNVRELGDIKRTQQREASGLIESRLSGASPYEPTSVAEELSAARAKLIKEAQEHLAPELTPLNENLSDLLSISSVNKSLRGGGGLVQDVGGLGVRGGLGSGVGRSLFGGPGSSIGGLLGMTLLNPKLAAGTGFAAGRAAETAPTLMRLFELERLRREAEEKQ